MFYELANYIKYPLQSGDEVNVIVNGISTIKCEVLRVDYNYCGSQNVHKVFIKSYDPIDNCEHDIFTNKDYLGIVLQCINI